MSVITGRPVTSKNSACWDSLKMSFKAGHGLSCWVGCAIKLLKYHPYSFQDQTEAKERHLLFQRAKILFSCKCSLIILQKIWAAAWQNQQSECAPSKDSDQPGHPPSLIRVFAVRMKKARVLSYPLSAQRRLWSDWADAQADLGLRWAHTRFVGFVMSRLNYLSIPVGCLCFMENQTRSW